MLTLLRLSQIDMRLLEEVDECVVVGVHINMGVVKVAPPHGECMHNGNHLSIMDRVFHLNEVGEGCTYLGMVLIEASVIVGKANKTP